MNPFDRENQGVSEFVTRFTEQPDGIFFELQVGDEPGNVRLSSGPHKSLPDAQAAAAKIVRGVLRERIRAAGIARRGERPAFDPAAAAFAHLAAPLREQSDLERLAAGPDRRRPYSPPTLTRMAPAPGQLAAFLEAAADAVGEMEPADVDWRTVRLEAAAMEPLEDEQLCTCGHLEGVHRLDGTCVFPSAGGAHRPGSCQCDWFEPVAQVEAVESTEVLS